MDNAPANSEKNALLAYFEDKTIGYNRFGEIQRAFAQDYKALG